MTEPVVLRPRFGLILCFLVWAIVAISLVSLIVQGDPVAAQRFAPAFLTAGYVCWMLFWYPCVKVDASGVTFVNLARTVHVTWPAITSVDTKYSLSLRTANGKFTAWAAPGPSRLTTYRASKRDLSHLPETTYGPGNSVGIGDIPSSESGLAALNIRRHWERLQRDGRIGALEGTGVIITWNRWQLIVLGVLVLVTLAAGVLA